MEGVYIFKMLTYRFLSTDNLVNSEIFTVGVVYLLHVLSFELITPRYLQRPHRLSAFQCVIPLRNKKDLLSYKGFQTLHSNSPDPSNTGCPGQLGENRYVTFSETKRQVLVDSQYSGCRSSANFAVVEILGQMTSVEVRSSQMLPTYVRELSDDVCPRKDLHVNMSEGRTVESCVNLQNRAMLIALPTLGEIFVGNDHK